MQRPGPWSVLGIVRPACCRPHRPPALLAMCAGLIALFSAVTPFLLGGGVTGQTAFILVGFGLLGLSFGQASGA